MLTTKSCGSPRVRRDDNLADKPAPKPASPATMGRGQKTLIVWWCWLGCRTEKRWEVLRRGGKGCLVVYEGDQKEINFIEEYLGKEHVCVCVFTCVFWSRDREQGQRKAPELWEMAKLGQGHQHRSIQGLIKNEEFCYTAVLIFKWWIHLALYLSNVSCVFPKLPTGLYKFGAHSIL